ncbi:SDR family NAD(P)-dependent oxidoreductase [Pseudonocardia acaciae]|uniref:SDR family NAD(P)-dependent oxidoreductase n=1 Tax=Pseudonocardia acaciae TaxID=551276 RepID=UPI000B18554A|nr:SDR family NAD(P)-dependent oxidoreductase [Pseudonocardia acaciae]
MKEELTLGLLDGKACLVTGGAGSIGLATARLFLADGARVALFDRDAEPLARAADQVGGDDRVRTVVGDVTNEDDVAAGVAAAVERFGRLDVLVANAGTPAAAAPVTEFGVEEFDATFAVHVRGVFLACKHALRVLSDGGSVVIVSSVAGLRADAGVCAYVAAKHAQVGLMRSIAKEVAGRGIRVNTIHPGPVDNAFQAGIEDRLSALTGGDATEAFNAAIPLGRHAGADEIARSILYLATDQSSFTTASTLVVDGGMSA